MSKSKGRGGGSRTPNQGGGSPGELPGRGRAYPLTLRLRVVEQAMSGAASLNKLSQVFGPSVTAIVNWVRAYEKGGVDALVPRRPGAQPAQSRQYGAQVKHEAVVEQRRECRFAASWDQREGVFRRVMGPPPTQPEGTTREGGMRSFSQPHGTSRFAGSWDQRQVTSRATGK